MNWMFDATPLMHSTFDARQSNYACDRGGLLTDPFASLIKKILIRNGSLPATIVGPFRDHAMCALLDDITATARIAF